MSYEARPCDGKAFALGAPPPSLPVLRLVPPMQHMRMGFSGKNRDPILFGTSWDSAQGPVWIDLGSVRVLGRLFSVLSTESPRRVGSVPIPTTSD